MAGESGLPPTIRMRIAAVRSCVACLVPAFSENRVAGCEDECRAKMVSCAVRNTVYPCPRAMYFTRGSVWPWFASKARGSVSMVARTRPVCCALVAGGSLAAVGGRCEFPALTIPRAASPDTARIQTENENIPGLGLDTRLLLAETQNTGL